MSDLTPQQARAILRARKQAHDSLVAYARYVDIPGVPVEHASPNEWDVIETGLAKHHVILLELMQKVMEGNLYYNPQTMAHSEFSSGAKICRRMMVMMPPGSAKSTYGSVVGPCWYASKYKNSEIILTGYGDTITKRHGTRARQLCNSMAHRAVFDTQVRKDMKAADNWALDNGSSYKAAGILSGITGYRADGLVWDDLTKGRKEADSPKIRSDTYDAYIDDARSRKKPNAWEIGIGTRWHEDESMGRILPEGYSGENGFVKCRDGNVWLIVCMPAQCERDDDPLGREIGEYIWPEWFGEDYWEEKKVNPRSWASLYQQRPAPDDGIYFRADMFKRYRDLPKELNHYISFDPAVSTQEDADETAIHVWGVDEYGRIYLIDEWVKKRPMDVWIKQLMDWIHIYRPMEVISESGVIRRASEPFIQRAMFNSGVFATFEYVNRHSDKMAMARPAQAMYSSGMILHPEGTVGDEMEDELLRFPTAAKDHRVDSVANLCLRLEVILAAKGNVKKKPESHIIGGEPMLVKSLMPPRFSPKRQDRWHKKSY